MKPDVEWHYWVYFSVAHYHHNWDIKEDLGLIATGVKISFPMSHNTLISVEEYVQEK